MAGSGAALTALEIVCGRYRVGGAERDGCELGVGTSVRPVWALAALVRGAGGGAILLIRLFCLRVQNKKLYLATFAAVLGPLSFGFVLGYSSPVIPELREINDPTLRLDSNQASWFGVSFCMMKCYYYVISI